MHSIPIWIRLPNLDLDFWTVEALSRIASILGHPIKLDNVTEELIRISYARILVEVSVDFTFPESTPIKCFNGEFVWQKVEYEWVPTVCSFCKIFGHSDALCKAAKVWVPKENPNQVNGMDIDINLKNQSQVSSTHADKNTLHDGDNTSTINPKEKEKVLRTTVASKTNTASISNPFNVLAETNVCMQDLSDEPKDSSNSLKNSDCIIDKKVDKGMHARSVSIERDNNIPYDNTNVHEVRTDPSKFSLPSSLNLQELESNMLQDMLMEDSDSSSSSIKRRRNKFKANKFKGDNRVVSGEPLVETNPEWTKLVSQFKAKSKPKKAKEDWGSPGGVMNGGISKR